MWSITHRAVDMMEMCRNVEEADTENQAVINVSCMGAEGTAFSGELGG